MSLRGIRIPKKVLDAQYAVRGEVVNRAEKIAKELAENPSSKPFKRLVACNIGNPQSVGQSPITFHRQVLSLLTNPGLLEHQDLYPKDVMERGRKYLNAVNQFGAYTHSKGAPLLRKEVTKFLDRTDIGAPPADPEDIFMTDGASQGVRVALECIINDANDGILVPIPQYPLYSASIARLGGSMVGYHMDETATGWKLNLDTLQSALEEFEKNGKVCRGMVVINPGNPTGNVLDKTEIEQLVKFAEERGIAIMADEVYKENVYAAGKEFHSFRKIASACKATVPIFSFHSISKGFYGECGLRGGTMHMMNVPMDVQDQIYKLSSMTLCSNTLGQSMMASIVNPPVKGDESYELYAMERDAILTAMKRKAVIVYDALNAMEGVTCCPVEGAMYAFPAIDLPQRFVDECRAAGTSEPDNVYAIRLLEATGVIVVPGSGFKQKPGTWHFRTTILPEESLLTDCLQRMTVFQAEFLKKYSA